MTLTIELTPDQEAHLSRIASSQGKTSEEYIRWLIDLTVPKLPMPTNGPELVAYWRQLGVIGSRPDITDSVEHAQLLRERAQQRESGGTDVD